MPAVVLKCANETGTLRDDCVICGPAGPKGTAAAPANIGVCGSHSVGTRHADHVVANTIGSVRNSRRSHWDEIISRRKPVEYLHRRGPRGVRRWARTSRTTWAVIGHDVIGVGVVRAGQRRCCSMGFCRGRGRKGQRRGSRTVTVPLFRSLFPFGELWMVTLSPTRAFDAP